MTLRSGGRLEDMRSFETYLGGSPTNVACGTARLGLRSAQATSNALRERLVT